MQLAEYMRLQYPQVLFRSDLGGVRLSPGLRMRMARLQSGRSWPDFFVAYPSHGYHGLFIEIKKPNTKIYTNKMQLVANPHIRAQYAMLQHLFTLGYQAQFGVGFERCKVLVDGYLGAPL